MKYTRVERLEIYKKLLADWNFHTKYEMIKNQAWAGFCWWFRHSPETSEKYVDSDARIVVDFPEMRIIEPGLHGKYWFGIGYESRRTRVKMIKYVIRYTTYKIMLEYMRDNLAKSKPVRLPSIHLEYAGFCSMYARLINKSSVTDVSLRDELPELYKLKPHHNYSYRYRDANGYHQTSGFWWRPFNYEVRIKKINLAVTELIKNVIAEKEKVRLL